MEGGQVLMDIGELVIEIQQVFVLRAVADDGWGKLIPAVQGIEQGEGKPPLPLHLRRLVDVVDVHNSGEVVPRSWPQQGQIPWPLNNACCPPVILPFCRWSRRSAGHRVALALIVFGELRHILRHGVGIALRLAAQVHGLGPGLLVDLPVGGVTFSHS